MFELLTDEKFWLVFATGYLCMIAAGPVNAFVPLVVQGFGFNTFNTIRLLLPAGVVIGSNILGTTYVAYKFPRMRCYVFYLSVDHSPGIVVVMAIAT